MFEYCYMLPVVIEGLVYELEFEDKGRSPVQLRAGDRVLLPGFVSVTVSSVTWQFSDSEPRLLDFAYVEFAPMPLKGARSEWTPEKFEGHLGIKFNLDRCSWHKHA